MELNLYIIDDDPLHHKLIDYLVKNTGISFKYKSFLYACDALTSIVSATDSHQLPDLILLDLNMPVMTGWSFLELFEAMGPSFEKPIDVVILTSSVSKNDKEKASKYSCVKGFFVKPFTEEMLNDILSSTFISINTTGN